MVRAAVHVSAVRTLAVRRLGQLKRRVRADIFDIIRRIALISIRIGGQLLLTPLADARRQILLIPVLFVLYLRHRRGFPDRLTLIIAIPTQL